MRRLTLSLINLVKTLEITTEQLKNISLHILIQKQIRKNTKTQVFLLLHFCTVNSRNVTSLCHAKSHNAKKYCSSFLSSRTADFQVKFKLHSESNINGTLSTWWPMFTSGKRFINLSFCCYLYMSQEDFFQPIFLVFYISWEQRRKAYGCHL